MSKQPNMQYIYADKDPILFSQLLDSFCNENGLSYKYRSGYNEFMKLTAANLLYDKSFIAATCGEKVTGCCFNYIEKDKNGKNQMCLNNGYIPSPWGLTEKITRSLYEEQVDVATKTNCSLIKLSHTAKLDLNYSSWNPLIQHGFIDSSDLEITINLTQSMDSIWGGMRKNHKRIIKKLESNQVFDFVWTTCKKLDYELHERYAQMHHECSGRITRPLESFKFQYELTKRGDGILLALFYQSKLVGCLYIILGAHDAVYASGVDDPSFNIHPIYHLMIWESIRKLKTMGYQKLTLGQPSAFNSVPSYNNCNTQKQLNIAHFKRGFGGDIRPSFMGVKYLCKDRFRKDVDSFSRHASELMFNDNA